MPANSRGAKDGAAVQEQVSCHCGPGSNPGVDATHGLSLLLVPSHASRGFSLGTLIFVSPQKVTFLNSNLTRNQVRDKKKPPSGCATSKLLFNLFILTFKP